MKKILKVILVIVLVMLIAVAALAVWQWKNIKSIYVGVTQSTEEISDMRNKNQEQLVSEINSYMDVPLRELTPEEKQQIAAGEISIVDVYTQMFEERKLEQAVNKKTAPQENTSSEAGNDTDYTDKGSGYEGQTTENSSSSKNNASDSSPAKGSSRNSASGKGTSSKPGRSSDNAGATPNKSRLQSSSAGNKTKAPQQQTSSAETTSRTSTKDEIISKYMLQLYGLQSEYTARAESTISQGAAYYESLKKSQDAATARSNTISHFTPIVRGIESECDARVEAVISNLKNDLEGIGANTDITGTIRTTYANEKQLKLSYYSSMYL